VAGVGDGLRRYIGERPRLFFGLYGARPAYRDLLVNRETGIVIEGFPRSGNTFAVYAFEQAQKEGGGDVVRPAHHLHAPAQVMRAVHWKIPCVVLIREPTEAVLSLVIRDPRISLSQAFLHYISLYEVADRYREGFVLASFEQVIGDYGVVIERVNEHFGTAFHPFRHDEENVGKVFATIEDAHRSKRDRIVEEHISRPSRAKEERKADLRQKIESPEVRALADRASEVYERLTSP
jgi:hypothetical protein